MKKAMVYLAIGIGSGFIGCMMEKYLNVTNPIAYYWLGAVTVFIGNAYAHTKR